MNKVLDYLQSEEGVISMNEYFKKLTDKENILNLQCAKFHNNYSYRIDLIINKIEKKYNSDDYINREYSLGREPMQDLYSFLFEVSKKYGEELDLNEDFLSQAYEYKGYVFKLYQGQGSFITIDKI